MFPKRYSLIIMHLLPFLLHTLAQGQVPTIPCPNLFQYAYDENLGGNIGLITIPKDGSSESELQVNMSMITRTSVTNNIQIVVLSKKNEILFGNSVRYAVKFPLQNVVPKLILIRFNGNVICQGTPDTLEAGFIQTSMWAKSTITTFSGPVQDPPTPSTSFPIIQPSPTEKNPFKFSIVVGDPSSINSGSGFGLPNLANNPFLNENRKTTTPLPKTTSKAPTVQPILTNSEKSASFICGKRANSQTLIIGGEDILNPGDFPWLAAILHREDSGKYKLHCTGNLISDRHVVTAGSCVRYHNAPLFAVRDLVVVLGKLNMEEWNVGGTVRGAKIVEHHPNYKQNTPDYDIAVILLNATVRFQPTVKPICLWDGTEDLDSIIGTSGTIVGWNKKGTGDLALLAQKVELPVVAQEVCLRSNKVFPTLTTTRTFCAGTRDNTKGPCTGDSGAGFMLLDAVRNKWHLRGFVGYSLRDPQTLMCDLNHYVIFIDVAKLRPWIDEKMQQLQ